MQESNLGVSDSKAHDLKYCITVAKSIFQKFTQKLKYSKTWKREIKCSVST